MVTKVHVENPTAVIFGVGKSKLSGNKTKDNPSRVKPAMVGNTALGAPISEAPSHEERLHSAAADEHVNATRDYVAGRIGKKDFEERKRRAASIMSKTPKNARY